LVVEGLEASQLFERHLCYEIQLWELRVDPSTTLREPQLIVDS